MYTYYIDIAYILILQSSLDHLDGGGDLIDHSSSAPIEKCCSFSETTSQHRQKQHHSILSKTTSQFITSQCFVQEVVGSIAPRKSKHWSTLFMKCQASHLSRELQRNWQQSLTNGSREKNQMTEVNINICKIWCPCLFFVCENFHCQVTSSPGKLEDLQDQWLRGLTQALASYVT